MKLKSNPLLAILLTLLTVAGCAAPTSKPHDTTDTAAAMTVPLFDNLGSHHHPVTTSSRLAQRYFDQGLRLTYAFNHGEDLLLGQDLANGAQPLLELIDRL